jgi:phosphoglycolate phosphatase
VNLPPVKLIVFDLDGTLVDSLEDIARSVNELLPSFGRSRLPHDRIRTFVGNGVAKLLERALEDPSVGELELALDRYLPIYRRRLLETTRPFPGVPAALETLAPGRILAVLTNKPLQESERILEGLDLRKFFRTVYGGDSFPRRKPDPMGLRRLMEESGVVEAQTLFVGDSDVDLQTAQNASVRSCLVTNGPVSSRVGRLTPDFLVEHLRSLPPLVHA